MRVERQLWGLEVRNSKLEVRNSKLEGGNQESENRNRREMENGETEHSDKRWVERTLRRLDKQERGRVKSPALENRGQGTRG